MAAPETRNTLFFSRTTSLTARATLEVGTSRMAFDVIDVDPLPHDVDADVGLVEVVGVDNLDFHAVSGGIEILHRHLGGDDGALPADVGIEARHVVEHAELDGEVLGLRRAGERSGSRQGQYGNQSHDKPP